MITNKNNNKINKLFIQINYIPNKNIYWTINILIEILQITATSAPFMSCSCCCFDDVANCQTAAGSPKKYTQNLHCPFHWCWNSPPLFVNVQFCMNSLQLVYGKNCVLHKDPIKRQDFLMCSMNNSINMTSRYGSINCNKRKYRISAKNIESIWKSCESASNC